MMSNAVVVVGANGDIGRALLKPLVKDYSLVICWVSPRCEIDAFGLDVGIKDTSNIVTVELKDFQSIKKAFDISRQKLQGVDRIDVVTCSGFASGSHSLMTTLDQFADSWSINFLAPVFITQLFAKRMIRKGDGKFVHLSSIQGVLAESGNLAYGSSKAALIHACKIFARELGPRGIAINTICPTVINSKMGDCMDAGAREKLIGFGSSLNAIELADVVALIIFLLDYPGTSINGQALRVDTGMPF